MADGGIGETALIGMAVGGVGSALTGGNPLKGALMGGALGGIGGLAGQGAAVGLDPALSAGVTTSAADLTPSLATADTATQQGVLNAISPGSTVQAYVPPSAFESVGGNAAAQGSPSMVNTSASAPDNIDVGGGYNPASGTSLAPKGANGIMGWFNGLSPMQKAGLGLGAYGLFNQMNKPNLLPGYTPPSAASYGLGRTLAAGYQPVRPMAAGGLTVGAGSVPTQGIAPADLHAAPAQPSSLGLDALASQYGISPQMVTQARQDYNFADGGIAELAVGGKLLQGQGDGMSDSIKANIGGHQEARLGDGEFVVSADVVSGLGNGSTDAGAKQLYSMMDRVRKSRTGTKKQGKQINPQRMLPA